jgi:hypothetical protein
LSLLSDLIDFVKTRPEGTSFSEIQGYLEIEDKEEVRNLISDGLNKNYLTKTGEKRGTRYLANKNSGSPSSSPSSNPSDDNDDVPIIAGKALEVYLNDATPIHGAVITHIENIVKFMKPKNLSQFIQNGRKIISYLISYDHEQKKNVISEKTEITRMNYFAIKSEFIIEKFDQISGKKEILSFPDYEELREELRLQLHAKH